MNKIRVAVVDDDENIHQEIEKFFNQFEMIYDFDFNVNYFLSCEEIYDKLASGNEYDLIFLDIEFPKMKGTDLGNTLRKKLKNHDTSLFSVSFTTS